MSQPRREVSARGGNESVKESPWYLAKVARRKAVVDAVDNGQFAFANTLVQALPEEEQADGTFAFLRVIIAHRNQDYAALKQSLTPFVTRAYESGFRGGKKEDFVCLLYCEVAMQLNEEETLSETFSMLKSADDRFPNPKDDAEIIAEFYTRSALNANLPDGSELTYLKRAVEVAPQYASALYSFAREADKGGHWQEAREAFLAVDIPATTNMRFGMAWSEYLKLLLYRIPKNEPGPPVPDVNRPLLLHKPIAARDAYHYSFFRIPPE